MIFVRHGFETEETTNAELWSLFGEVRTIQVAAYRRAGTHPPRCRVNRTEKRSSKILLLCEAALAGLR
jgi:hypothetical protein